MIKGHNYCSVVLYLILNVLQLIFMTSLAIAFCFYPISFPSTTIITLWHNVEKKCNRFWLKATQINVVVNLLKQVSCGDSQDAVVALWWWWWWWYQMSVYWLMHGQHISFYLLLSRRVQCVQLMHQQTAAPCEISSSVLIGPCLPPRRCLMWCQHSPKHGPNIWKKCLRRSLIWASTLVWPQEPQSLERNAMPWAEIENCTR